jgi:hypothetical protein
VKLTDVLGFKKKILLNWKFQDSENFSKDMLFADETILKDFS